jgi:hypothetical protein
LILYVFAAAQILVFALNKTESAQKRGGLDVAVDLVAAVVARVHFLLNLSEQ